MKKIIVCGSRAFPNMAFLKEQLDLELKDEKNPIILTGLAPGADSLARKYALDNHIKYEEYPADWSRHGKKAGFLRNLEMLKNADKVIAFWNGESRGTKHTITIAKEKGIPVTIKYYKTNRRKK